MSKYPVEMRDILVYDKRKRVGIYFDEMVSTNWRIHKEK